MKLFAHLAVLSLPVAWSGCGGEPPTPVSGAPAGPEQEVPINGTQADREAAGGKKAWDASRGSATISGTVRLEAKAPKRRPIGLEGDPKCAAMHAASTLLDETVVVNEDGTLRNAFVWVKKGLEGFKFAPPADPVRLMQEGCAYVPHVVGVQVGQPLAILNKDDLLHNVHSFSAKNPTFNVSQPKAGQEEIVTMKIPELPVKVKCDVHGWMATYVCVVPSPFYAVTADGGTFELGKLPPGRYTVEAWHEKYGALTQEVEVKEGETREVSFAFKAG